MPDNRKRKRIGGEHEFRELLRQRCDAESQRFNKLFGLLLIVGVVFFVAVYVPYVEVEREREKNELKLQTLDTIQTLVRAEDELHQLRQSVAHDFRAPLRLRTLNEIEESAKQWIILRPENYGDTLLAEGMEPSNARFDLEMYRVQWSIRLRFLEYQRRLQEHVLRPLEGSLPEVVERVEAIKTRLESLRSNVIETIHSSDDYVIIEPEGNRERRESVVILRAEPRMKLRKQVEGFFVELEAILQEEPWKQTLQQARKHYLALEEVSVAKSRILEQQPALQARRQEILNQLEGLGGAFGGIRVNLSTAVMLFPMVLGVGFLFCASVYDEAVRCRVHLYELYVSDGSCSRLLQKSKISLTTPLLFWGTNTYQGKLAHSVTLTVPALVYLGTLVLGLPIADSNFGIGFGSQAARSIYWGSHLIALVAFVIGALHFVAAARAMHPRRPRTLDD